MLQSLHSTCELDLLLLRPAQIKVVLADLHLISVLKNLYIELQCIDAQRLLLLPPVHLQPK
jgi:hypothetical protein